MVPSACQSGTPSRWSATRFRLVGSKDCTTPAASRQCRAANPMPSQVARTRSAFGARPRGRCGTPPAWSNHRAPDGGWLPGGASSVGAGALAVYFPDADPAVLDRAAAAHEPASVIAYPLASPGERFPFLAPEATAFVLGSPASDADLWAALLQGVGFAERLCLDTLHSLGAPMDGTLTFTGGAARSPYWNQLRADILGRPAHIPEETEPALGMAALAAHGTGAASTLAGAADRMVRVRTVVTARPAPRCSPRPTHDWSRNWSGAAG